MKKLILLAILLAVSGCTRYHYEHVSVDGSSCDIIIHSWSDLDGAKVNIVDDCQVLGSIMNREGKLSETLLNASKAAADAAL